MYEICTTSPYFSITPPMISYMDAHPSFVPPVRSGTFIGSISSAVLQLYMIFSSKIYGSSMGQRGTTLQPIYKISATFFYTSLLIHLGNFNCLTPCGLCKTFATSLFPRRVLMRVTYPQNELLCPDLGPDKSNSFEFKTFSEILHGSKFSTGATKQ